MPDKRYLKQRYETWYLSVPVPRELRGRKPWGKKPAVVKSLHTRDLSVAQQRRWELLAKEQEKFRVATGEIQLTKPQINEQAWTVFQQTLRELEKSPVTAEPEADESPEEAGLIAASWQYEEALEAEDYALVGDIIKRINPTIGEGSETWELLGEAICAAKHAAIVGRLAAIRNQVPEPPVAFVRGGVDPVALKPIAYVPKAKLAGKTGPKLSDAVAAFLLDKQHDKDAALIAQSEHQYKMSFRLLQEFTHDAPVTAIDRAVADNFIDAIKMLPPNWGKSKDTRGLTLAEVLAKSATSEDHISNKTINRHISALSGLFKWLQRKPAYKFTAENPFANQWRKEAKTGATRWLPYRVEELNKLFAGDPPSELRWIMLVGLFSGARLNEICQLRTEDVQRENGVHYFNIGTEHEGQRVKSEAGFRHVPIHSALIKAGILDYHKRLEPGQLWPGLKPGGPDRKLSWYTTRQFTAYRREVGITRSRVNFHSLRKTFVTCLDNAGVAQGDVAALVGHERGFSFDRYSGGKSLLALKEIVERVSYPGLRLKAAH